MIYEQFKNNIIKKIENINIQASQKQIENLYRYMKILLEWNEKVNLTAIIEPEQIISKHFVDSLTILKYIKEEDKIIDIGTGAGFPGIPIKIFKNQTEVTLLDSLNKRINFLNAIIKELNLERIETIHARAEELCRDIKYKEKYQIATSRAVASMSKLAIYMLPFIAVGGKCICMKGNNYYDELKESENIIKKFGGEILGVDKIQLPDTDIERNIIIIEKIKEVSNEVLKKSKKTLK